MICDNDNIKLFEENDDVGAYVDDDEDDVEEVHGGEDVAHVHISSLKSDVSDVILQYKEPHFPKILKSIHQNLVEVSYMVPVYDINLYIVIYMIFDKYKIRKTLRRWLDS